MTRRWQAILAPATIFFYQWVECTLCCFFFSSRRRHTRFDCDWSSDVCSSDLPYRRVTLFNAPEDAIAKPRAELKVAMGPDVSKDVAKNEIVGRHVPFAQRQRADRKSVV